jgi:hypothetical protein
MEKELNYEKLFSTLVFDYICMYGVEASVNMVSAHCNLDEDTSREIVEKIWEE